MTYKYMYSYPKEEKKLIKKKKRKKKKPKKFINYRGLYISSLNKKIRDAHGNRTEEMKKMIKQKFTTLMA